MRYEDWDILLFPQGREVPMKEFKVTCHVVHDLEFSHAQGSFGLPTLCCFVPSLPAGVPFQISIHSWTTPIISQFTKSYSMYHQIRVSCHGSQFRYLSQQTRALDCPS
ncbi:hypothetical protein BGZ63DRAFT_381913 [Mariannaea sp. PMI_226]|nr:hypothetical protein BGZ63DRAFT_381913 [Mariannaea sp. PMI_226]